MLYSETDNTDLIYSKIIYPFIKICTCVSMSAFTKAYKAHGHFKSPPDLRSGDVKRDIDISNTTTVLDNGLLKNGQLK